jgi:hypothetical protein
VPQVVEYDRVRLLTPAPEAGGHERVIERVAHVAVEQVPPDDAAEHEVVRAREVPAPAEAVELHEGPVGERDRCARGATSTIPS